MPLSSKELVELSGIAIDAATDAGRLIASRSGDKIAVEHKEGGDHIASQVVTEVDLQSEAAIVKRLLPTCEQYDIALLTEEAEDDLRRLETGAFWCVDPLDGTLAFIESTPGYSVSIALVAKSGLPLIGVIYNPVTKALYSAVRGQGASLNGKAWGPELDPPYEARPLTAVFDPSMDGAADYDQIVERLEALAERMGLSGLNTMHRGGAVVNACRVLENAPACYFKFPKDQDGGGSLWDFAASACIYNELGAIATDFHGQALELNREESSFMNHRGVMYASNRELASEVRREMAR